MHERTDDIELKHWDGLRCGEAASLEWLYNRYFKLLYNYGRKISGDDKCLEDGIHDLFVDLWRFRNNLSATTSVRFYLYRSLRRRLVRNANHVKMQHLLVRPDYPESHTPCEEEYIIEKEIQYGK